MSNPRRKPRKSTRKPLFPGEPVVPPQPIVAEPLPELTLKTTSTPLGQSPWATAGQARESIALDLIHFAISKRISRQVLHDETTLRRVTNDVGDSIEVQVRYVLAGEKLPGHVITYPATWWDAFKDRWFPVAALTRWPAQFKTHTIEFAVLYPDFKPKLPYPNVPKIMVNDVRVAPKKDAQ